MKSMAVTAQTKKLKAKWIPEIGKYITKQYDICAKAEDGSDIKYRVTIDSDGYYVFSQKVGVISRECGLAYNGQFQEAVGLYRYGLNFLTAQVT